MQMWYYVSSTYADPGIFTKGGGGGGGEVRGSRQKKAPLPGKKLKLFFVFSPNLQLLNSFFTEGGGGGGWSDFFVLFDSFRPINNLLVIHS